MNIIKRGAGDPRQPPHLAPLFDAMKANKVIKSVKCCQGTRNKDNPETYFTIENFKALTYHVQGHSGVKNDENRCDYVVTDKEGTEEVLESGVHGTFYMSWVLEFEL